MADSRALVLKILGDVSSLNKSMKDAQNSVNGAGMSIEKSFDQVKKAVTVASAAVVGFAVAYGKTAVNAASDLAETVAKSQVIFGNNAAQIEAWGATAATAFGQSQRQALDAAANFAIFGKAAGLAGNDLVGFSTDFVELASDLASFNNTSPEQAITAIGAALRGEAEPIRQYGVLINEAALRQAALELGIVKTTKEALTPQQRVLAAQKLIFEQTSDAQGDYERTSDGLANTQRSLKAQLEDVNAEIGQKLLPFVTDLAKFLSEKAIPFITKYKDELQILAGATVAVASGVLAINAALKVYQAGIVLATAATAIFNAVVLANPFGLVVIAIGLVIAIFVRLESQTGLLRKAWEWLTEKVRQALDIFKKVANFFGADFETAAEKHQKTIQRNTQVYDESRRAANQVTDGLRMGVLPAMEKLKKTSDDASNGIDQLNASTKVLIDNKSNASKATKKLSDNVDILYNSTKKAKTANDDLNNSLKESQRIAQDVEVSGRIGETGSVVGEGGVSSLFSGYLAAANTGLTLQQFVDQLGDVAGTARISTSQLIRQASDFFSTDAIGVATGGVSFNELIAKGLGDITLTSLESILQQPAGFRVLPGDRIGQSALTVDQLVALAKPVTINVNGTVIDPEGTARAVQQVIQDSNARSGFQSLTPVLGLE